jgi:hypothetical protein
MVKKVWYPWKGLAIRNTHVKYQRPSIYHSKVIGKVKVSDRMIDRTKTICPRS